MSMPAGEDPRRINVWLVCATCVGVVLSFSLTVSAQLPYQLTMSELQPAILRADPPIPAYPVQLMLDDDSPDSSFGISGTYSQQFLWFNQFANPGAFTLEEIWVLFPPGPGMTVGAPVELVVMHDPDGDPTNGADLVASLTRTIQVVDGNTFSVYPVSLSLNRTGDLFIGVVNRFTDPAATPAGTEPASMDTTMGQGRSWWALWNSGSVPNPVSLPPDLALVRLTGPTAGNWMIRAFGAARQEQPIPMLTGVGLAVLLGLLATFGVRLLRRSA